MPSRFWRSKVRSAIRVPPVVELALVLVGPLLGDVVRRVGRAGGVVDEPRLVRVLRTDVVQPLDALVGDVVGEVVELAVVVALRGHAEGGVVLGDDRVVLAGGAGEEAPPVVEAPARGPVVERPGGAHLAARRHVPLAEAGGDVAVLAQDARQGGAAARARARVAGEGAGQLGDAAHAHAMVVAAGEHGGAGRRADRGDVEAVVRQAHLADPRQGGGLDAAAERVGAAVAGVVDEDDQHVGRAFGRRRPGDERPVGRRMRRGCARPSRRTCGRRSAARCGRG